MKKLLAVGIVVVLAAGAAVLLRLPKDPPASNAVNEAGARNTENTITIKDYAYTPTKLKVKKGTTVTWVNEDAVKHDVSPAKITLSFAASKLLSKNERYSVTFNEVGTYDYNCSPHPYMKGTIEVTE